MERNLKRAIGSLLSAPLTTKLVVANLLVAVLVAAGALVAADRFGEVQSMPDGLVVAASVGVGLLLIGGLDALLVRLALRPVRELERVAERVREGDLGARPEPTPFADRQIRRVTEVFDQTLNELADLRSRLRGVARRAVEARERERRELAAALQDDIAQRVAACLLGLRVARQVEDPEERRAALDDLREEAAEVLDEVRSTARDLRPPELGDIGLGHAVQAFARSFSESTGIQVAVEAEATGDRLEQEARLSLYRIVQDLLMGVVQHTECTDVRIRMWAESGTVIAELSCSAAGSPIEGSGVGRGDASYLLDLRERAGYVGGRVVTARGPDGRPALRVEVPAAGEDRSDAWTAGRAAAG